MADRSTRRISGFSGESAATNLPGSAVGLACIDRPAISVDVPAPAAPGAVTERQTGVCFELPVRRRINSAPAPAWPLRFAGGRDRIQVWLFGVSPRCPCLLFCDSWLPIQRDGRQQRCERRRARQAPDARMLQLVACFRFSAV